MTVKHSSPTLKQLLFKLSAKLKVNSSFKLTLVQKRPKIEATSKVIKLTCYDFCDVFNPQLEYNRILDCLELPYGSMKNITSKVKGELAPHTLHLLIPVAELESITDYPKLLASVGYYSVIDTEKVHLFINKRRPIIEPAINIVQASREEESHEKRLLKNLDQIHSGVKNTYQDQDPFAFLLKQKSKYYFN